MTTHTGQRELSANELKTLVPIRDAHELIAVARKAEAYDLAAAIWNQIILLQADLVRMSKSKSRNKAVATITMAAQIEELKRTLGTVLLKHHKT